MTAKDIYASVLHQQLNIVGFKAALADAKEAALAFDKLFNSQENK